MYTISVESNEAWYQDYDMSITIEYDEETGDFYASAFTSTYFRPRSRTARASTA